MSQMHFKLGFTFGRGFLSVKVSIILSINVLYGLPKFPKSLYNFRTIFEHEQMRVLFSKYYVSFTVDRKAASILSDIILGRYPCVWCSWDKNDQFNDNNPLLKYIALSIGEC